MEHQDHCRVTQKIELAADLRGLTLIFFRLRLLGGLLRTPVIADYLRSLGAALENVDASPFAGDGYGEAATNLQARRLANGGLELFKSAGENDGVAAGAQHTLQLKQPLIVLARDLIGG